MKSPEVIPEIWILIFQELPTQNDLGNVCKVSKSFQRLATPILYRSVIFRSSRITGRGWQRFPDDDKVKCQYKVYDLSFGLFHRLLDDRNEQLRAFVRELTLERLGGDHKEEAWQKLEQPRDLLAVLVEKLPNLEHIYFRGEFPMTQNFVDALSKNKRSPHLHLLGEQGRTQVNIKMPFVCSLHTEVNVHARPYRPPGPGGRYSRSWDIEPETLNLHELFTAYPNLESLSVSISRFYGGCVATGPPSPTRIFPLMLSANQTFPPLRSLSLSGYYIQGEEPLWRERFLWHKLRSLSLGSEECPGFLDLAKGRVHGLTHFTIATSSRIVLSTEPLNAFLSSFHTLESLTTNGVVPSLSAIVCHSNLKQLCLHSIESPETERITLNATEITDLDRLCPNISTLEVDMNPDDGWPRDVIKAIATGFTNLRYLNIHIALGMVKTKDMQFPKLSMILPGKNVKDRQPSMQEVFASVLTMETARDFANQFLDSRGSSELRMIALKTGEDLRWFSQVVPLHVSAEKECGQTIYVHPPLNRGDELRLRRVESEHTRASIARRIRERARRHKLRWETTAPRRFQAALVPDKN